jgi:hypothetical protein
MCRPTRTWMLLKGADPDLGGGEETQGSRNVCGGGRAGREAGRTRGISFHCVSKSTLASQRARHHSRARKPGLCESYFDYPISDLVGRLVSLEIAKFSSKNPFAKSVGDALMIKDLYRIVNHNYSPN